MNDILSRFLVVLDSEAEAYFCFVNYMEAVKDDFLESGMMKKIGNCGPFPMYFFFSFLFFLPFFPFLPCLHTLSQPFAKMTVKIV